MKSVVFSFVFGVISTLHSFGQNEKVVESQITNVTVFLNKAQVTRYAKSRIEAGKTNIVISGLTSSLEQESIQVSGKGNFIVMGIAHRQNYLKDVNLPKPIQQLKDSIEGVQLQLNREAAVKEILNKEEQLLLSNQKVGGANQNLTATELKAMADFFRTRLTEIHTARMKQEEKIKKLNDLLGRLHRQLNQQTEFYSRNTSEIVISVSSETAANIELEVNYIVSNAGWTPVYDIRAIDTKKPLQLSYKANVFQSTGEQWNNIKLKLSTANPSLGGVKPELFPWYLNFYQPITYDKRRYGAVGAVHRSAPEPAYAKEAMDEELSAPAPAETTADYVSTIQTTLNTEFDIALPYTVTSAGKPTLVDIRNYELEADYIYSVAPKLDKDAFLLARATGWGELSLLPGEANIFFEGTFVAKSVIDPNSIKDTLAISLGRDKRIVVKREKLKDFTSRKLIGTNQRDSYAYEISVRNTKAEVVKIVVEDQMPVSQNSQIEVTVIDTGGSKYNKVSGKMLWELSVAPNETKKVSHKFEIKYPKDKIIAGLD